MVISLQDMTQASFRKTHIEYMVINHYQLHMGWYGLQVHSHEPYSSMWTSISVQLTERITVRAWLLIDRSVAVCASTMGKYLH